MSTKPDGFVTQSKALEAFAEAVAGGLLVIKMDKRTIEKWSEKNDILHWAKMYANVPWQGYTEKVETAAKSITPALGLQGASLKSQMIARNFAHLLEYHKVAKVVKEVDVNWVEGLSKHLFFFDDSVVNVILLAGCGLAIVTKPELLLPFILIGLFYFGSDKFILGLRKLN